MWSETLNYLHHIVLLLSTNMFVFFFLIAVCICRCVIMGLWSLTRMVIISYSGVNPSESSRVHLVGRRQYDVVSVSTLHTAIVFHTTI